MKAEPQQEHQWLQKFVGEWTYESDAVMGPDQPPVKFKGSERVRSLGDLWIVAEGEGEMPEGDTMTSVMTLGYDPQKGRYVGTWVGSPMSYLWVYEGALDAEQRVLPLDCEGPNMAPGAPEGAMAKYQDVHELVSDDHRIMRSRAQGDDGNWFEFMITNYRRKV